MQPCPQVSPDFSIFVQKLRMKLSLGFSPCPNDTFLFYGIVNGKVDTEGLDFDVTITDVEELNEKAFSREINITKLSYHAFGRVAGSYQLLRAGSAVGRGNGPLVIGRTQPPQGLDPRWRIAIPGKNTTANLLFSIFFPAAVNKTEYLFSDIEEAILTDRADAGVIIHENRFTYASKGLQKIADLGQLWETHTGLPIPLGGIAVDRNLPHSLRQSIGRVVGKSVLYGLSHPGEPLPFVKKHARNLDQEVITRHIDLFVNDYTADLGEEGAVAVRRLFSEAMAMGILNSVPDDFLLEKE